MVSANACAKRSMKIGYCIGMRTAQPHAVTIPATCKNNFGKKIKIKTQIVKALARRYRWPDPRHPPSSSSSDPPPLLPFVIVASIGSRGRACCRRRSSPTGSAAHHPSSLQALDLPPHHPLSSPAPNPRRDGPPDQGGVVAPTPARWWEERKREERRGREREARIGKKITMVRRKRERRKKYMCKRGVFSHADHLRGPYMKIYFCTQPLKWTAWENILIFVCSPLSGSSTKIDFLHAGLLRSHVRK